MKKRWIILLVVAVVLASYAPALRNGFVWDDTALVLRDPLIRSWRLIPEGFEHFLFTDASPSDFYRPMQRLSYTLEYWARGFRPGIFHLDNIFCHLAAALALLIFADELLRLFAVADRAREICAPLATLIWAIHPVQSAAVTYISGRADPLAAAFGFAGLYCGLRMLRAIGGKAWLLAAAATVAFICSALSKESGLIFPLLWIVILIVLKNWRGLRNAVGITIFVSIFYLSLRISAEHFSPPPRPALPVAARPLIVARAVAEYAGLLALPINLHMERDVETHPFGFSDASIAGASRRELQTLLGLVLIAALLYWMVRARRRPGVFVSLLLAFVSYLPVSGVVLLNANVAEHWLYLPSAFLFLAFCLTTYELVENRRARGEKFLPLGLGLVVGVWIIFLAARTFVRNFDWKDQRTFLQRTIADGGASARMLINLAGLEMAGKHFDAANRDLQSALQKDPDQPLAFLNLGALAIQENNFKLAHEALARAAQKPITEPRAQELLAVLHYKETGDIDAMRFRLASRTGPPDWSIEKRYIMALEQSGAPEQAVAELKACLVTQWYRADTWQMLSDLLLKLGKPSEAADAHKMAQDFDVHLDQSKSRG